MSTTQEITPNVFCVASRYISALPVSDVLCNSTFRLCSTFPRLQGTIKIPRLHAALLPGPVGAAAFRSSLLPDSASGSLRGSSGTLRRLCPGGRPRCALSGLLPARPGRSRSSQMEPGRDGGIWGTDVDGRKV